MAEHAPGIADHRLRRHGAVGDDLRDAPSAVLVGDVVDDAVAAVHAEVDVEVRHRHALGVQEALEQQVVLQRVDVGDAERVGDERTCARTAPRPHRHAVGARPADEVRDDEEIARETHLADDRELAVEPRPVGRAVGLRELRKPPEARLETERRLLAQEVLDADAVRHREGGQPRLAEMQREAATARDRHAVGERFRQVGEERRHLVGRTQVLLLRVAAGATGVGELHALVDADPRLVGVEIVGREEAHIVGRDQRHPLGGGERHGGGEQRLLALATDARDLEVVAVAETLAPEREVPRRVGGLAERQRAADIAVGAAGQRDQPADPLGVQPIALDERQVALATVDVGPADERREVAVAALIHAQQRDTARLGALAALGHQQVDADDGLHAARHGIAVELHHREQVHLIGDRHRRHAGLGHRLHEFRDAHHAVDQRVFGVQAQMDEGGHGASNLTGPKLLRCTAEMPWARSAARCAAVG